MDIENLIINPERPKHIEKHDITVAEVLEVLEEIHITKEAKMGRIMVIGLTKKQKCLAIIIGKREEKYTYGLITARPADRSERKLYYQLTQNEQKYGKACIY